LLPACALMGVLALALPAFVSATTNAQAATPAGIMGRWQLMPDRSDDGGRALEVLVPPGGDGESSWPHEPEEGAPGRRGRPGRMGGGVGRPGGMGGFPGGPRGGFPGSRGARLTPEERAAVRQALRFAVEAPDSIELRQQDHALVILYPDGRTRRLTPDGHKHKLAGRSEKVQWKNQRLVVETKAGDIKIKETFDVATEPGLLHVDAVIDHPRYKGELKLTRIYHKEDTTPPAPASAEPAVSRPEE
jgi:hypothetical protein